MKSNSKNMTTEEWLAAREGAGLDNDGEETEPFRWVRGVLYLMAVKVLNTRVDVPRMVSRNKVLRVVAVDASDPYPVYVLAMRGFHMKLRYDGSSWCANIWTPHAVELPDYLQEAVLMRGSDYSNMEDVRRPRVRLHAGNREMLYSMLWCLMTEHRKAEDEAYLKLVSAERSSCV